MARDARHRRKALLIGLLLLAAALVAWAPRAAAGGPASEPSSVSPPASIHLHGTVLDQQGRPIAAYVEVIDKAWQGVGSTFTAADGSYELTAAGAGALSVTANPLALPENLIAMDGGYSISRLFPRTKAIVPRKDNVELDFALSPAAVLRILAYSHEGTLMPMGEFNEAINPSSFFGYQGVFGVFPISGFSVPVPTESSVGMLRAASHPEKAWEESEPCFLVPPGETVYLMVPWEVRGVGTFPLRADNRGQGYTLGADEVRTINLVYELAETEYRRAQEQKSDHEAQGHLFSAAVLELLSQAEALLSRARSESDERSRALLGHDTLRLSTQAKEKMTLEVAEAGIAARQEQLSVVVQDATGSPISGAQVTYSQTGFDFLLGHFHHLPNWAFLDSTYKATREMGFEALSHVPLAWKDVSPAPGVYDFSAYDAALERARLEGWDVVAGIEWLVGGNLPAWVETLELPEFKAHLREFVKTAVTHLQGRVKYLDVACEKAFQANVGGRYADLEFESGFSPTAPAVQYSELIELIQTAFDAAREIDSGLLLGYTVDTDYGFNRLNVGNFGAWPCPYAFLKSVLDSGVRPDYIGLAIYPTLGNLPVDLSTVAAIMRAYHDLSGLPVMITEMASYSSRAEDYGLNLPTPGMYWHEGMTQKTQADWVTSVFKIALGQPYVVGLFMTHGGPDYPPWLTCPNDGDWSANDACIGVGTDFITRDYERKQAYYALQGLFHSWRGQGSARTDAGGTLNIAGLAGEYSTGVTTADGLLQTFQTHLDAETRAITLTFRADAALQSLDDLVTDAQGALDWSLGLGRELGYPALREELAQARSALAAGEYRSARSLAESVLDATAIAIDGDAGDWEGIPPIATAEPGGVEVNAPGIDLKALYGVMDEEHLYLMVEVYDPPISIQPGLPSGSLIFPFFNFSLNTDTEEQHGVFAYLPYNGQIEVFKASDGERLACLYTVAYASALELKVPLDLLDDPSRVSVCAFVQALENGEAKGAKGFDCPADVLQPKHRAFVPLAGVR